MSAFTALVGQRWYLRHTLSMATSTIKPPKTDNGYNQLVTCRTKGRTPAEMAGAMAERRIKRISRLDPTISRIVRTLYGRFRVRRRSAQAWQSSALAGLTTCPKGVSSHHAPVRPIRGIADTTVRWLQRQRQRKRCIEVSTLPPARNRGVASDSSNTIGRSRRLVP
jgi:hypothetical protein